MNMPLEIKGYLLFLLCAGCALFVVLSSVYVLSIIEIAKFFFSMLSMGVGRG